MDKKQKIKIVILYYNHVKVVYSEFQKYIMLIHHFIMFLCFLEVKMDGILIFLYIMNLCFLEVNGILIFLIMMKYLKLMMKMKQIYPVNVFLQVIIFAYRLQVGRPNESVTLHYYGRLFQQWIVDMYTVMEQTCLNYLRFNQKQIRAELYNGLQDAMYSGDSTT